MGFCPSVDLQNIMKNSKSRFGNYIAVVCTLIGILLIIVLRDGIKCVVINVKSTVELKDKLLAPWGLSSISAQAELVSLSIL